MVQEKFVPLHCQKNIIQQLKKQQLWKRKYLKNY